MNDQSFASERWMSPADPLPGGGTGTQPPKPGPQELSNEMAMSGVPPVSTKLTAVSADHCAIALTTAVRAWPRLTSPGSSLTTRQVTVELNHLEPQVGENRSRVPESDSPS